MLSPIKHFQGDNINISTKVLIGEVDSNVPNYIRLIYSWKNPTNYRFVETMFIDKSLYLNSGIVNDGRVLSISKWPGVKVSANLNEGDVLDLSLISK